MNFSDLSGDDLHEMCLRGDQAAWKYIYNYVLAIARSPRWRLRETPEDMAQSIVCHLLDKGIERVKTKRAFRSFVRRVAVNFILDSFKGKAFFALSLDMGEDDDERPFPTPAATDPDPESLTMGHEFSEIIDQGIESWPRDAGRYWGAYVDYKMGKYRSYKALAEKFGAGIGTLSSRIKRCLDKLRMIGRIRAWLGE